MVKRSNACLIVPTIRRDSFVQFFERWDAIGLWRVVDLVVVEDNPTNTFPIPTRDGKPLDNVCMISWKHIEGALSDDSWIIPRRSDTVRSYGYLWAYHRGYEFMMTLDDDCYPPTESDGLRYESGRAFVESHLAPLRGERHTRWFSSLSKVKPRGVPFQNIGRMENTVVNHGLWTNVLDYDAPTQLVDPAPEEFSFDNRVVPQFQYLPFCGMNVAWRREATVLMYHLLMGQEVVTPRLFPETTAVTLQKLPFDRFGDIWCGIIMKKVLDSVGLSMTTGMPYIRHERASNPFTNLRKEANGLEVNEVFWEHIDLFKKSSPVSQSVGLTLAATYFEMGIHIESYDRFPEHVDYFKRLGLAMRRWADFFVDDDADKAVDPR